MQAGPELLQPEMIKPFYTDQIFSTALLHTISTVNKFDSTTIISSTSKCAQRLCTAISYQEILDLCG